MNKPLMLKSTSFIAMLLLSQLVMAKAIGTVAFAAGDVTIAHADKTVTKAAKNAELNAGDTIETKEGRVQLSMIDGGKISLQPNTIYKINQFEFTGKEDGSEFNFTELVKGGLRTISGLIGHKNRDHYQLKTAVATIGIRGTEFTVNFNDNNLLMTTNHGSVDVCNVSGCLNAITGQTIEVTGIGGAPMPSNKAAKAAAAPPAAGKAVFAAGESIDVVALANQPPPPNPILDIDVLPPDVITTSPPIVLLPDAVLGNDSILVASVNSSGNLINGSSTGTAVYSGGSSVPRDLVSFADNSTNTFTVGTVIETSNTPDGLVNLGRSFGGAINGQAMLMTNWVTGIATPLSAITSLNGANIKGKYEVTNSSAPYIVNNGFVTAIGLANSVTGSLELKFGTYKLKYDLRVPIAGEIVKLKGKDVSLTNGGSFADIKGYGVLANGAAVEGFLVGPNAEHAALQYGVRITGSAIPGGIGNLYGSVAATKK